MSNIELLITVDGKDAILTIDSVDKMVDELKKSIAEINQPLSDAFAANAKLKEFAASISASDIGLEELTTSVLEFVKSNSLTESELSVVNNALKEIRQNTATGSAEYHKAVTAITALNTAHAQLTTTLGKESAQIKATPISYPVAKNDKLKLLMEELLSASMGFEELKEATIEYTRYNQLTEAELTQLNAGLRELRTNTNVASAEYQRINTAISALNGVQSTFNNTQQQASAVMKSTANNFDSGSMAMRSLGYTMNDVSTFAIDFRMGLMAIGNNIPMVIEQFMQMKQEGAGLGKTLGQTLTGALMGPGGVFLAINAIMTGLTLLSNLMRDTEKEVSDSSKEFATSQQATFEKTELLSRSLTNENIQLEDKVELLKTIQKDHPNYLKGLDLEKTSRENLIAAIQKENVSLQKNMELKIIQNEMEEKLAERRKIMNKDVTDDIGFFDRLWAGVTSGALLSGQNPTSATAAQMDIITRRIEDRKEKYDKLTSEIDSLNKELIAKVEETKVDFGADTNKTSKQETVLERQTRLIENRVELEKQLLTLKGADEVSFINTELIALNHKLEISKKLKAEEKDIQQIEHEIRLKNIERIQATSDIQKEYRKAEIEQIDNTYVRDIELLRAKGAENLTIIQAEIDSIEAKIDVENDSAERETLLHERKLKYYELEKELASQEKETNSAMLKEREALAKLIADNTIDEFERKKALLTLEYDSKVAEVANYANAEEMKYQLAIQYDAALRQLDSDRANNQLQLTSNVLNQLAGLFGQHTAMYKLLAIAQASIDTYRAAAAALAPPPVGLGPVFGPILAATTIATGLAQVAKINETKMPGYEKGGIVVGEKGPEIIAPAQDYATFQASLILQTISVLRSGLNTPAVRGQAIDLTPLTDAIGNLKLTADGENLVVVMDKAQSRIERTSY